MTLPKSLDIFSIFTSLDGEVNCYGQGGFTTFIRFAGCSFAGDKKTCSYCDTKYSQKANSGKPMLIEDIVQEVLLIGCNKVTITGGEPFYQSGNLLSLLEELKKYNICVSVETNGSYFVNEYFLDVIDCVVMDWKLSNAGNFDSYMKMEHFLALRENDYIKFVVGDEKTYLEALTVKAKLQNLGCNAIFAFSPMFGTLDASELFLWLKRDLQFDAYLNVQLHKVIWPKVEEGVEH